MMDEGIGLSGCLVLLGLVALAGAFVGVLAGLAIGSASLVAGWVGG